MSYREVDPARAAEDEQRRRVKEAAERYEVERVKKALKKNTVLPWGSGTFAKLVAMTVFAIALVALGVSAIRWVFRERPCGGVAFRCVASDYAEICLDDRVLPQRCKTVCREKDRLCERPADLRVGDICGNGCDRGTGVRAMPEELRCSTDKRTLLDCAGCVNVWSVLITCAPDEECSESVGMGGGCVKVSDAAAP